MGEADTKSGLSSRGAPRGGAHDVDEAVLTATRDLRYTKSWAFSALYNNLIDDTIDYSLAQIITYHILNDTKPWAKYGTKNVD